MLRSRDTSLLSALKTLQQRDGYLTSESVAELAERSGVSESRLWGVASFYSLLNVRPKGQYVIRVCNSISCHLSGAGRLIDAASEILGIRPGKTTLDGIFTLETVGCLGACGSGPAALVNDRLYTELDADRLAALISSLRQGTLTHCEQFARPTSVRAVGKPMLTGPAPAETAADSLTPDEILEAVDASGLRGRGGAAFPTGRKWRLCLETPSDARFVVCNADEGEPGTFKDRYLMTERPDLVISGIILAGRAIGAQRGYIYLRGEYTDAEDALKREITRRKSGFTIEIVTGAGAYVCGEETSLLESMEGRRGVPRLRPPYPPEAGLFDQPTLINNVETLANVPFVVANGPDRFRRLGTDVSPGTKLFCVSGDVERPGMIEAPLGTQFGDILAEAGARNLKAALVGGASGRIVPTRDFGRRLCYEDLSPGSGAVIAIGRDRSMREVAANLMAFFRHESCGECAPCRIGTARAEETLSGQRQTDGRLTDVLRRLGTTLTDGSRCGLGQTAANALIDMLDLFPEEFE